LPEPYFQISLRATLSLLTPPTASGSKAEQVTGYKGESWEKKREEEEKLIKLAFYLQHEQEIR
jgi:hypothetical protein